MECDKKTWAIILPNNVIRNKDTLAARGLEEQRVSLIFAIIVNFMKACLLSFMYEIKPNGAQRHFFLLFYTNPT